MDLNPMLMLLQGKHVSRVKWLKQAVKASCSLNNREMHLDGEEMKSITLKTFVLPPLSVSQSALQVILSETDLASLEVKNKNILLLWELLGCNYETFPCRALRNIQINHQQNALSVSGYFHSSLVN